jgi:hypothetical protein
VVPYKITWYGLQLFHSDVLVYSVSFAVSWLVGYAFRKTVMDDRTKKMKIMKIFH